MLSPTPRWISKPATFPRNWKPGHTPTQYAYNLDHQLLQVIRPDGSTIDLGYDNAGRISILTLPSGQVSFGYHPSSGNLLTITAQDGGTLTYAYDGRLPTSETWAGTVAGSVQYTYDDNFRIISQHVNGALLAPFQYDADGLLVQAGALILHRDPATGLLTGTTLGNLEDTRTYDRFGKVQSNRTTVNGTEIFASQYVHNAVGHIMQKAEAVEGQTNIYSYGYDLAGRLIEVKRDGTAIATYHYDSNGNRLSYTSPDGTVAGTYDVQDRLTHYGTSTYTYTANGELHHKITGSETTTYTYDASGNLMGLGLPDGTQIEYVIDGRDRRVGKKVNGAFVQGWLYAGQLTPVAELDGSGTITAHFVYGTRPNVPEYMIKGGHTYRIITDHLGSPRRVIDTSSGHIVQRMDYDVFGRVAFDDNPGFQPFGFAGGLYDPDSQLTRFGARDYDAETGRWTAKDPIRFAGGNTNLYGYVLNDPVNWIDPEGLAWTDWQENIWATLEGTVEESPILKPKTSYGKNTNNDLFVALPDESLKGKRVELEVKGKIVTVDVGDVGPWNGGHTRSGKSLNDPYWDDNKRPQAECGTDLRGRKTNRAGIDISAALAKHLGMKGNVKVRWRGLP